MLQSAAIRLMYRSSTLHRCTPMFATKQFIRPSCSSVPSFTSHSFRFGVQKSFIKSGQVSTFVSLPSRDEELQSHEKSKKQQIQALLMENEALKNEVKLLKAAVTKKPNKLLGTLQQYGLPFLAWWTSLYLLSGVSIYAALDTNLISGASIIDFIMQIGLDKFIDPARLDPTYGNIAVIVNECLEVIRFPITLATLPYIKRIFSRAKAETK